MEIVSMDFEEMDSSCLNWQAKSGFTEMSVTTEVCSGSGFEG